MFQIKQHCLKINAASKYGTRVPGEKISACTIVMTAILITIIAFEMINDRSWRTSIEPATILLPWRDNDLDPAVIKVG